MSGSTKFDDQAILAAAYDLEGTETAWLKRLLDVTAPALDQGLGTYASTYRLDSEGRVHPLTFASRNLSSEMVRMVLDLALTMPPDVVANTLLGPPISTVTAQFGAPATEIPFFADLARRWGAQDCIGIIARNGVEPSLMISAPSREPRTLDAETIARWTELAKHFGAALRLRRALVGAQQRLLDRSTGERDSAPPSADGERQKALASLEGLRDAALRIERASAAGKWIAEDTTSMWAKLVAGGSAVVDHFDHAGRRYLIAYDDGPGGDEAITDRELRIVALIARGHTNKHIAYELGISESTVSAALQSAARKLGMTRIELVGVFATAQGKQSA